MPRTAQHDKWLFFATLALCSLGALMVFSSSAVLAREEFGGAAAFLTRQFAFLLLGGGLMFKLMNVDYHRLREPAVVFPFLGAVLVMLVAVFFLDKNHATHRWIRFGPVGIQPSELAKLATILFLAWFLEGRCAGSKRQAMKAAGPGNRMSNGAPRLRQLPDVNNFLHTLLPGMAPVLLMSGLIVMQPDLGTSFAVFVIALIVLWVAGLSPKYAAGAMVAALPLIYFAIVRVSYRYERVMAFLNPESDPQGRGFQMLQSLIAVGSGGLTGVGFMESRQKLFYLPEAHTDFIYAVLCEELGFIGGAAVVILFGIFAWRGVRAAWNAPDDFSRLLATGITGMVVVQALLNLSVVLGMMPTKGIPLPFISYGGSSLLVMLMGTGVLLNISRQAE